MTFTESGILVPGHKRAHAAKWISPCSKIQRNNEYAFFHNFKPNYTEFYLASRQTINFNHDNITYNSTRKKTHACAGNKSYGISTTILKPYEKLASSASYEVQIGGLKSLEHHNGKVLGGIGESLISTSIC